MNLLKNCKILDLSQKIDENSPTWDGDCGFQTESTIYPGSGINFHIKKITMKSGIGTHMDSPYHCFDSGISIEEIPLVDCFAPLVVIHIQKKVHASYLLSTKDICEYEKSFGEIAKGSFVIISTGWSQYWTKPQVYRGEKEGKMVFPTVSEEAALMLLDRGIVGLGVDTLSPDLAETTFPVHRHVLGAGKYIIENIRNPEMLPSKGAYISALPLPITKGTESPLRLIAFVDHHSQNKSDKHRS